MGNFNVNFDEFKILASVTIPPRPIARTCFWHDLTAKYWAQMTEGERAHLFEWMNRNDYYKESLEKHDDTKVFHARFDPDNQYMVKTKYKRKKEEHRAFKLGDRFYTSLNTFIAEEYILEANKFTPQREY